MGGGGGRDQFYLSRQRFYDPSTPPSLTRYFFDSPHPIEDKIVYGPHLPAATFTHTPFYLFYILVTSMKPVGNKKNIYFYGLIIHTD